MQKNKLSSIKSALNSDGYKFFFSRWDRGGGALPIGKTWWAMEGEFNISSVVVRLFSGFRSYSPQSLMMASEQKRSIAIIFVWGWVENSRSFLHTVVFTFLKEDMRVVSLGQRASPRQCVGGERRGGGRGLSLRQIHKKIMMSNLTWMSY